MKSWRKIFLDISRKRLANGRLLVFLKIKVTSNACLKFVVTYQNKSRQTMRVLSETKKTVSCKELSFPLNLSQKLN